jgi:type VI secretion system secreted protein VgrG
MKLVAGRGNVSVQAHQGNVEIKASGRISIISAEGIDLQAPEIKMVAQGAQADLGKDSIVHQCADTHVVKAAKAVRVGPGGGTPAALNLPSTKMETDERIVLRHHQTRKPIPNQRYIAHLEDGRTIEGVSDAHGRTSLARNTTMDQVRFELLPPNTST